MSGASTEQHRTAASIGNLTAALAVLAGGLLGSGLRAVISEMAPITPGRFPLTTLVVNVVGSFALGVYLARRQRAVTSDWSLRFWAIGGLGSFTTFSTFSAEVFQLISAGTAWIAASYVLASLVGGIAAAVLGERLGRAVR